MTSMISSVEGKQSVLPLNPFIEESSRMTRSAHFSRAPTWPNYVLGKACYEEFSISIDKSVGGMPTVRCADSPRGRESLILYYLSPNISRAVVRVYLSKTQDSADPHSGPECQVLQLVGEVHERHRRAPGN